MKKYVIKSYEEECGDEYLYLFVPEDVSKETVEDAIAMASKYAVCHDYLEEDDEERKAYDEHFDEMFGVIENSNGQEAFIYYLTNICGWKVEFLTYEFEFEW